MNISRIYGKGLNDFELSVDPPHGVGYRGVFG